MELRPGYKLTEVGVIPDDWAVRSIGQTFRLVNGCAFKPEDWKQSGTPIIRIENLNDPSAPFNFSQAPVAERNRVEPGDLLFAWSGTIGSSFGARVWAGPSGVLNQHIFKVAIDERHITLPFSLPVFARVEEDIAKQAHGFKASFVHVKKSDLVKVPLPLPPLPEQSAIAEALGDVDAVLAGLDRLIAKKRDLKQAAMQQLLTGQTRLPGFQGEWKVGTLKHTADISAGINKPLSEMGSGALYVTVQDLYDGTSIRTDRLSRMKVSPAEIEAKGLAAGDIVFGKSSVKREGIGYPSIFLGCTEAAVFSGFTYRARARPGVANASFLFYALRSARTRRWLIDNSQASALTNINQRIADAIPIRTPPTITEQIAIATVLSDMDAELASLEARRNKTRALKQGMMQELLTGKTRLV